MDLHGEIVMHSRTCFDDNEFETFLNVSPHRTDLLESLRYFSADNYEQGHKNLEPLMSGNDPDAWLISGVYSKRNESLADFEQRHLKCLEKAADYGSVLAMYCLGVYYDVGELVEINEAKAMDYFRKAAKAGHVRSMYLYGVASYYGMVGVGVNVELGLELINKATSRGEEDAQELLKRLESQ